MGSGMMEFRQGLMPLGKLERIFVQIKKGGERVTGWIYMPSRDWLSGLTDSVTISTYALTSGDVINLTGKLIWIIPEEENSYWENWFKTMLNQ